MASLVWHGDWILRDERSTTGEERHVSEERRTGTVIVEKGIGLGSVIAVTTSWSVNQSVLWAIVHGVLSWLYVIYYVLVY
jgi:hypothetical protein